MAAGAFGDKQPDPGYFVCYYCSARVEGKPPPDAWIKGVVDPQYRYVCSACRQGLGHSGSPRPDPGFYRCLGCRVNQEVVEAERANWMRDPAARIHYFDDGVPKYVGVCPACGAQREAARQAVERGRRTLERRASDPYWQMVHVRELQLVYEAELTRGGQHRYDRASAIERAVELEMLVADWARHPGFMQWLRDARHQEEVQDPDEDGQPEEEAA